MIKSTLDFSLAKEASKKNSQHCEMPTEQVSAKCGNNPYRRQVLNGVIISAGS